MGSVTALAASAPSARQAARHFVSTSRYSSASVVGLGADLVGQGFAFKPADLVESLPDLA